MAIPSNLRQEVVIIKVIECTIHSLFSKRGFLNFSVPEKKAKETTQMFLLYHEWAISASLRFLILSCCAFIVLYCLFTICCCSEVRSLRLSFKTFSYAFLAKSSPNSQDLRTVLRSLVLSAALTSIQ